MNLNFTLQYKEITPGVINLRQFTNGTDILTFIMDDCQYDTTDLSTLNCYAVCDMPQGLVDEVKLTTKKNEDGSLMIQWHVTGYTTQKDGVVTYQIVFKNINGLVWSSYKAIIFVNSSIDVDGKIAGQFPSILMQWEERMTNTDTGASEALVTIKEQVELAKEAVNDAELQVVNAKDQVDLATKCVDDATGCVANATQEANRSEEMASKSEGMKNAIEELINYEPTNIIEREVSQARGGFAVLSLRLDSNDTTVAEKADTTVVNEELDKKLDLTGGVITGAIQGKTSANVTKDLIKVDDKDVICLGDHMQPIGICSSDLPYWFNGTDKKNIATESFVTTEIGKLTGLEVIIVDSLPATGKSSTIYFLADPKGEKDAYDEYMWINSKWELIGSTKVDLSDYYTKSETDTKLENYPTTTEMDTAINSLIKEVELTLPIASWTGSGPYTQNATITGLTDTSYGQIIPSNTCTLAEIRDFTTNNIKFTTSGDTVTFTVAKKPTTVMNVCVQFT